MVWSATDRPARMIVDYATTERFVDARRLVGDAALPETGLTAKAMLTDLPPGQDMFYRVTFQDLSDLATYSQPVVGRFKTAPGDGRDVTFIWSGDTAGQGWGISPDWGGMRLYDVMRRTNPDFVVHSGDMIYADGPLKAEEPLPDGSVWRNVVTEAKSKVAETIDEQRGNYTYNMLDLRLYRGPNGPNVQTELTDEARILGLTQTEWLKRQLAGSRATSWKVIAADMPLGLVVYHDFANRAGSEAVALGDGPPLGRELEIADILRFIAANEIRNVTWITADVHYYATHLHQPNPAQFQEFKPFYEFVSGPIHAGGFGPNELDNTFGPEVFFTKHPPAGRVNTPPTEGIIFFGHVTIDGRSGEMVVSHRDLTGGVLHQTDLRPEG